MSSSAVSSPWVVPPVAATSTNVQAWEPSHNYPAQYVVLYGNALWLSNVQHVSGTQFDQSLWLQLTGTGTSPGGGGGGNNAVSSVFGRVGAVTAQAGDYTVSSVPGAAPVTSPALNGVPTVPTAPPNTSNNQIASTSYSDTAVIAERTRAQNAESNLAPNTSPVLSGTPTAPTPTAGDNSTRLATTAFTAALVNGLVTGVSRVFGRTGVVTAQTGDYAVAQVTGAAPLASPALTGTPTAPTAAALTRNTQLATTAYADAAVAALIGFTNLGNVTTTVTLNLAGSIYRTFTFVLTAPSCAISVINAVPGSELTIIPFQDASPPRVVTHPTTVLWTSTGAPTLSGNASAPDRFQYTVLAVDGSGNPTQIVGSLGFTSGSPPSPINPPIVSMPLPHLKEER